ncbi:MAG: hypothetical protein UV61_C0005G0048 [Candidatus Gottesmanbacteria bacterium GW2011_GWB1_43_11]|uniref:Uncharacterized protein n=1 Tax=Candidatus Gottesmanbacteria bacterium GW2011_GWB1_43_11 TaxID=1618446 RepID=A0A0G1CNF4_9BACT|nr:MAG: hypothetical protein UV04_C0008G0006 [Candidatus Gottesmanbacteria bacterium GW2011_GWA2_42_16]KKS55939.1 MAG: hypothetical protein UV17_C0005G0048 [Candidatus Gottesmanbacteria bacterium GW2011_GWA1_42_26]KKS81751.1 MAG: hypothetical protein UV55_C0009G0027 [Candidatus Gottesmanbacteria bacterium GW2011_GWC1_43_10]KKS87027.1 MAG: hypothetical protein UV61_C0005G0048 [Candidatus Gottesmanbacteria bacterium GW2011_GWB1_43_11]OGG07556.1 MAG: hypothetical protein A2699_04825 [Candidatus Go
MKKIFKGKQIYLLLAIFLLVIVSSGLLIAAFGQVYQSSLEKYRNPAPLPPTTLNKAKIRKVTIRKGDEANCIEVTPDGVIRVFAQCGGELTDANRVLDARSILKLFKFLSNADLDKLQNKGSGIVYELTIETDTGTQVIYITGDGGGGGGGGGGEEIIPIIEDIKGSLPSPSPESSGTSATPAPSGSTSPQASPGSSANPSPSASPQAGGGQPTFVCDYQDFANPLKRPFNVSNILCSTDPSPAPQ